jgi:uncharacterized SAM-binding protein YcdF (DUF218 family)
LTHTPPPRQLWRQTPARRSRRKPAPRRKSRSASGFGSRLRPRWLWWSALAGFALVAALLTWAAIARQLAPTSNTALARFDAIVVLGVPADSDGNPTPAQLARVTEGVHEYERGIAPRLILTGGAAANRFVEARVMARTAHALGIPESAIFIEPDSRDTIQNTCYAARIMKAHGWHSAEVVAGASQLPRAGLILSHLPIEWSTHVAPPLTPESGSASATALETLKTMRYLVWARQVETCQP